MSQPQVILNRAHPQVVGSFGNARSFARVSAAEAASQSDLLEIRLDLLAAGNAAPDDRPWSHLNSLPLLFTARRGDEGGAGALGANQRADLLEAVLDEASLIDVELVSAGEMTSVLDRMKDRGIPWIASWHDFEGRPDSFGRIPEMAEQAADAGAACFKAAVRLHGPGDLTRLAEILATVDALPLSLMGMGPLAPVSRLLCAQYGSVLNYGYLGDAPTAPGQWSAELLKKSISASEMI